MWVSIRWTLALYGSRDTPSHSRCSSPNSPTKEKEARNWLTGSSGLGRPNKKTIKRGVSKVVAIEKVLILRRGLQSQRDEMFIELRDHPDLKSSGGAKCLGNAGILRSSGAEEICNGNVIYKHLAALRPGQDLLIDI